MSNFKFTEDDETFHFVTDDFSQAVPKHVTKSKKKAEAIATKTYKVFLANQAKEKKGSK